MKKIKPAPKSQGDKKGKEKIIIPQKGEPKDLGLPENTVFSLVITKTGNDFNAIADIFDIDKMELLGLIEVFKKDFMESNIK